MNVRYKKIAPSVLIPISEAMLCWNEDTKAVGVMRHPADRVEWLRCGYRSDVGAKLPRFHRMTKDKKMLSLFTEGIDLIRRHNFDPESVFSALGQIKECHEAMRDDPFVPLF
jgi:hypothetical protein